MIYILAKSSASYEYEDLEDMIVMASTKIDEVLEYAYTKIPIYRLSEYVILVNEDGGLRYDNIYLTNNSYDHFIEYASNMFSEEENEDEYRYVCCQLRAWCDAIKEKNKKLKAEKEQKEKEEKEKQERKLYEELKAKYGD